MRRDHRRGGGLDCRVVGYRRVTGRARGQEGSLGWPKVAAAGGAGKPLANAEDPVSIRDGFPELADAGRDRADYPRGIGAGLR
jgi:hypothetical protein